MDDRFDLEPKPEPKSGRKSSASPRVSAPPGRKAVARSWRNSVLVVVFMAILLGVCAWVGDMLLHRHDRPDLEGVEAPFPSPVKLESTVLPRFDEEPVLDIPKLDEPQNLEAEVASEREKNDPEAIEEAMRDIRIAQRYIAEGNWESAEVYATKAIKRRPDMNLALRVLGVIYTQRGRFDKALSVLLAAREGDRFNADVYCNLAAVYMHKGMLPKAEEMLQTALKISPDFPSADLNMGLLYLMSGRFKWAAEFLGRSVERFPKNEYARNNLAVALLRVGKYEESRVHLRELMNLDPDLSHAYFNMAITYSLERDFENAMIWIQEGARHCSPVSFHRFMSDTDFNGIRNYPPFQQLIKALYGESPALKRG
ncbi:MAG: tetratricopeptide repeat protein [Verrucomicrobiota bacterium]